MFTDRVPDTRYHYDRDIWNGFDEIMDRCTDQRAEYIRDGSTIGFDVRGCREMVFEIPGGDEGVFEVEDRSGEDENVGEFILGFGEEGVKGSEGQVGVGCVGSARYEVLRGWVEPDEVVRRSLWMSSSDDVEASGGSCGMGRTSVTEKYSPLTFVPRKATILPGKRS